MWPKRGPGSRSRASPLLVLFFSRPEHRPAILSVMEAVVDYG